MGLLSSSLQIFPYYWTALFEVEPKLPKLTTMDFNSAETVSPDIRDEPLVVTDILQSVPNPFTNMQPNTQLFSFLALLNAYIPESHLLMSECQQVLGPLDPIHGGPPFKERMEPFTAFINTSQQNIQICITNSLTAQRVVEVLADLRITRSSTVKRLIHSLCADQVRPDLITYIKDLLTKREMGEHGRQDKFSRLIKDILHQENDFYHAVSVLKTASQKFRQNPYLPQTLSRLYLYKNQHNTPDSKQKAEYWAKAAIKRAPNNSYMADSLGQIYKSRLCNSRQANNVKYNAKKAFKAFKDVEEKAEREEGPEMRDTAGVVGISKSFNNRGLFGFIQVAKIAFEKLPPSEQQSLIIDKRKEVEAKFDFFEWYLTYSQPKKTTLEPHYFWKDVSLCYLHYTTQTASESTSFPGLLDCLNHGLFMSKGRWEVEKNGADLEEIQGVLKTSHEINDDDIKVAERYILSNIILSNKMPNSPHLTSMTDLYTIIHRFLATEVGYRSPEFYLLVLLLFWPEERIEVVQEQEQGSDEEQERREEAVQLPLDLEQYVTFMEKAFERGKYAKYLRGRYLLPLFFLGKGSGLSKWIHKSKVDAIVERNVNAALGEHDEQDEKYKVKLINDMWMNGEVWQLPEIADVLLPVKVEPCQAPTSPQENEECNVIVCTGGKKIRLITEVASNAHSPTIFYLGFTIRGPVLFKVGSPHMSQQ